jgi:transcriptional regulator with XRE-family HTH domain
MTHMPPTAADIRRAHGRRLVAARVAAGYTQADVAEQLTAAGHAASPQAVSQWETGDTSPSLTRRLALAAILDCRTDDLFSLDDIEAVA